MSLSMNYQSLGVKLTGHTVTVPDNRLAKLMYYLDCAFAVIQYDGAEKYTDYASYYLLSDEEEQVVIGLAAIFNPKVMSDLSLFVINSNLVPSGSSNQFYELTDNRLGIHINSEVIIGGVSRKVLQIMACTASWIERNFIEPFESYSERHRLPPARYSYRSRNNDDCCESLCECLSCTEACFDSFCCFLDCGCSSKCKRCWCTFCIIYFLLAIIVSIIINA